MVSVSEATAIIQDNLFRPPTCVVNILDATGRVLAETVRADRDFPPFDRVTMDGIAIAFQHWENGIRTFTVTGTQAAGEPQKRLEDPSKCFEVMTGAVLPEGCDTVIRYEDVEVSGSTATITTGTVSHGQNIHAQGSDATAGNELMGRGEVLAPSEVALLAAVGKSRVEVFASPRIAIISSGDELVAVDDKPAPWQIRRSNSYALQSALRQSGVDAACYHLQDDRSAMEASLREIVEDFDVLIVSGGVSKGKFDFVPQVLHDIGIRKLFHQVSQRPGKPFWFGVSDTGKVAFALPGNPVSTFMCFYRYVKPWLQTSLGVDTPASSAILAVDFFFPAPLTYFLQVGVRNEGGKLMAYPDPGGGSGDFANLKNVTGFLELPLGQATFYAGEVYPYFAFRP